MRTPRRRDHLMNRDAERVYSEKASAFQRWHSTPDALIEEDDKRRSLRDAESRTRLRRRPM